MSFDAILAKSPSIVFQPGGVAGGLVVTDWEKVQEFVALRKGACTLYVDDSFTAGAGALVPGASGITDGFGRLEIRPYRQDGNGVFLLVGDGATLKGLYRIAGTIGIFADTQGVIPAFDWDYSAGGSGAGAVPVFYIEDEAMVGNLPTATAPAVVVPAGNQLAWNFSTYGGVFLLSAAFLVEMTAAPSTLFGVHAENAFILSGGSLTNFVTGGAGTTFLFQFDSSTTSLSTITPTIVAAATIREQTDSHVVEMTFSASTTNVLAALQTPSATTLRALPLTGLLPVHTEGFGGTGGGGGGGGGDAGVPGGGGGGSGGALYQRASITVDLSHRLDITVGAAGAAGAAGAPTLAGGNGSDGASSFALDFDSNVLLASFFGSTGGEGGNSATINNYRHGGASYPGTWIQSLPAESGPADPAIKYGMGFLGAGGKGAPLTGFGIQSGAAGQGNGPSLNVPGGGSTIWAPGGGGAGGATSNGGGGGGAGIFANGGVGGAETAGAGNPGGSAVANSGAGAGGGAGGVGNTDAGGAGGAGSDGWVKLTFVAP